MQLVYIQVLHVEDLAKRSTKDDFELLFAFYF